MKLTDAIGLYEEVPPQDDPGRMTLEEFLREMNPGRVHHPSHAYDVGIDELNIDYARENLGSLRYGHWKELAFVRTATGFEIIDPETSRALAVIHEGILYHSPKLDPRHLSENALTQRGESSPVLFEKARPVKYLHEVIDAVDNTRSRNLEAMPHVLQRVQISGESFEVRTEKEPSLHSRQTIRILNDKGQNVAQASDEWGATLVMVAREHRGVGLGKLIAEHWNRWNPRMLSGGFTQAGEATATAMWKSRVRQLLAQGWYSRFVRRGEMSVQRFQQIVGDLGTRKRRQAPVEKERARERRLAVMVEPGQSFIVYDISIFESPPSELDPDKIFAHGFFRSSGDKTFLFSLDYERPFHALATYIALQMARDAGYMPLWNGDGYGDILELDGLEHVRQTGDLLELTADVINLEPLARKERALRKKQDPYGEYLAMLLEISDWKWRDR